MDELFDLTLLRRLAGGDDGLSRGENIFRAGRVDSLRAAPDRASARVRGSARFYRVKLWRSRGELLYNCSCPAGRDRLFCKHLVAVGLAWLHGAPPRDDQEADLPPADLHPAHEHPAHGHGDDEHDPAHDDGPEPPAGPPPVSPAEVRTHVANLDKRRLVDLVMEALDYDEILRRRLMLETTGAPAGRRLDAERLEVYRRLLVEAIETGEYVDYDGMPDYVQGVEEALRPLHVLLEKGQADAVIELSELAVVELDRAADLLDTSDGSLNGVYDELQRLHLEACRAARPDPVALAGRLLDYELEGGLGIFNNAANAYAEVLGPRGLEAYRRRLTVEWNRLPPLRAPAGPKRSRPAAVVKPPDDDDEETPFLDHRRFQLSALMERAAATAGADPDTLAAVRARDLSSPQDFLGIARVYEEAGRPEQAATWAEKGLAAFPRAGDGNDGVAALRALLAILYTRLDRREDALSLAWAAFLNRPGPERLVALREATPPDAWPKWRAHAHAHLRTGTGPAGRGLLVEALLSEDDAGAALVAAREAEAQSPGTLRPDLWLALANRLEQSHPADALEILRGQLDGLLADGGATAPSPRLLRQTGEILRTLRSLFTRVGRPAEFTTLRANLRHTHRHHRGLVRLLDALDRRR